MDALDLIIVDEPHLTDLEIQRKTAAVAPGWCYLGYRSFQQIKENPTLPAPVLLLQPRPEINDLLTRHNELVFVVMDRTHLIWQLQNYEGQTICISPDNSKFLGGHRISAIEDAIEDLVSILLEGF
jgi:hypothetical protein